MRAQLKDLRALRAFGANRPSFSDSDLAARRWLGKRMEAAGLLGVQLDGMGSVYGSSADAASQSSQHVRVSLQEVSNPYLEAAPLPLSRTLGAR